MPQGSTVRGGGARTSSRSSIARCLDLWRITRLATESHRGRPSSTRPRTGPVRAVDASRPGCADPRVCCSVLLSKLPGFEAQRRARSLAIPVRTSCTTRSSAGVVKSFPFSPRESRSFRPRSSAPPCETSPIERPCQYADRLLFPDLAPGSAARGRGSRGAGGFRHGAGGVGDTGAPSDGPGTGDSTGPGPSGPSGTGAGGSDAATVRPAAMVLVLGLPAWSDGGGRGA
jgi:hypothetical protein